ncbi:hypothetical protein TREMEDRAFT_61473 [Tremella mesenterica DSM 1558]|uniref:uncharacterized protein n=1 Tax=Tremella mesenterica (strain ATCC 24925 / CBS 8224 / DSM 1558 / NBRC 9311 / NRRL Y-6157 / RJB 2259-6 / UBC 559-6) TaxID=578456 RepID=UPI0003F4907F|nr:uncharacterized protein TREMEDRAFT_61473 [Tremella mesenterica DSM 1558]EIW69714.1 hypothetical protein TREMEDRAFT_61473 [Tremella mesenterica DSM 1558]
MRPPPRPFRSSDPSKTKNPAALQASMQTLQGNRKVGGVYDSRLPTSHLTARRMFDRVATLMTGISIGDRKYSTFQQATQPDVPHWPVSVFSAIFTYFSKKKMSAPKTKLHACKLLNKPIPHGKRVKARTVLHRFYSLCATYDRARGEPMDPGIRRSAELAVKSIIASANLDRTSSVRAAITPITMQSLVEESCKLEICTDDLLQLLLYTAIATSTGVRPSSVLRSCSKKVGDQSPQRLGCRWKDFRIWLLKGETRNTVMAWYKVPHGKTINSARLFFPLRETINIAFSAPWLLLLLLDRRGLLQEYQLDDLLDPRVLNGKPSKEICLDPSRSSEFVFLDRQGGSRTAFWINKQLKQVSVQAGFRKPLTTYAFRHMVAYELFKKVDERILQLVLGHNFGSGATFTYLGRCRNVDDARHLTGNEDRSSMMEAVQRTSALPDSHAPQELTPTQLESLKSDTELTRLRDEQRSLEAEIFENHGDLASAPKDLRQRHLFLGFSYLQWHHRLQETMLDLVREDYFAGKEIWGEEDALNALSGDTICIRDIESATGRWAVQEQANSDPSEEESANVGPSAKLGGGQCENSASLLATALKSKPENFARVKKLFADVEAERRGRADGSKGKAEKRKRRSHHSTKLAKGKSRQDDCDSDETRAGTDEEGATENDDVWDEEEDALAMDVSSGEEDEEAEELEE